MIRLGLILIGVISLCSLNAKEIFNAPFRCCSGELEFGAVKSVTFYYLGNEYIDIDRIVKSISKEKASVILTGEKGVDGRTLSSNMFIDVMLRRNVKEKAYLVMIDAYVKGDAQKMVNKDKKPFTGSISVASDVLVFSDATQIKEVEEAISHRLQGLVDLLTDSAQEKPTFFVLH